MRKFALDLQEEGVFLFRIMVRFSIPQSREVTVRHGRFADFDFAFLRKADLLLRLFDPAITR